MTPRETKSALARRLKIHRSQLDALLAKPGAPAPDRRKRYSVREVADFVSGQRDGATLDTLRAARLREVQLRCEKLKRELAQADREVVTVEFAQDLLLRIEREFTMRLYQAIESDLPPKLDGQPAAVARVTLREWADTLIDEMKEIHNDLPPPPNAQN